MAQPVSSLDKAKSLIIHDVDRPRWWRHRLCTVQPSQYDVTYLDLVCKSLTLNLSFSALTKHWALILLSKLSEDYAVLEKSLKYIIFGVHVPLISQFFTKCFVLGKFIWPS